MDVSNSWNIGKLLFHIVVWETESKQTAGIFEMNQILRDEIAHGTFFK